MKVIALSSMRYPVCSITIGDNVISAAAEYCVGGDGRDKGSARPGEIAGIAKDARALKPCEIEPFDLPPSFTDEKFPLLCATTQEGL